MESWLNNCVTETDDRSAAVPKQELWDSFCTFMNIDMEVGKDLFLAYLGKAFSNVGYRKVQSVFQRGRAVSYNGINLKTVKRSGPVTEVTKSKKRKTIIRIEDLQQWIERNYCEGGQDDVISKQDLWLHYSGYCGISDDDRPVFFSLIGNILSKHPAFRQVTRCSPHGNTHRGKHSAFKFLKKKDQVTKTSKCQHSQDGKDEKSDLSTDINDRFSSVGKDQGLCALSDSNNEILVGTREKAAPDSCIQANPQRDPPMRSESSGSVAEEQSLLLADLGGSYSPFDESFDQAASLESEGWDENPSIVSGNHDCITLDKPTSVVPRKKNTQLNTDFDDSEDLMNENTDIISDENQADSDSGGAPSEHLYEKYHRKLHRLLPSHLPGRPTSFQSYLKSTYPQSSNFDVERAHIQSSCGSTPVYKDARLRCFVAACFPPIKVGSFVDDCDEFSFEGDGFPQFSQVEKGNFACQICIPYLKWAILNSHPHSAARSKQATTDAILDGTAKLEFSGTVQVHEHSLSKCHLEAKRFWEKKNAEVEKTRFPTNKGQQMKSKSIYNFFKKTENPLN